MKNINNHWTLKFIWLKMEENTPREQTCWANQWKTATKTKYAWNKLAKYDRTSNIFYQKIEANSLIEDKYWAN